MNPLRRNKQLFFLWALAMSLVFGGCASEDKKVIDKVTLKPADSTVAISEAYVEFLATATYDDKTTGDITSNLTWKSFATFQTDSTSDLLFQDPTSNLAVLRTTGKYTIQATWKNYYSSTDATGDLRVFTTLTVE